MRIVAVSGGEIGRPKKEGGHYPIETLPIDKEIVRLTGKKNPKLLFIPTASGDSRSYYAVIQNYFGKRLGCNTEALYLFKDRPTRKEVEARISGADIIYVGGGNTLRMLKLWRKLGIDKLLEKAGKQGKVLSGISAGAICWFKYGNSDSLKFSDGRNPLIKVWGLDFVPLMICPHYDVEADRKPSLRRMIKGQGGIAIALDNCTAIQVQDGQYRILTSSRNAHAYKVYRKDGKVIQEQIPVSKDFKSLDELILK